jgi:hypothetical protein
MIGEDVTREENARDQLVAFRSWFRNHAGEPEPAWSRLPDPLPNSREGVLRIENLIRSLALPSPQR